MWSNLQRKAIESALSLSESVLGDNPAEPQRLLRSKLLDALSTRVRERIEQLQAKQKNVITLGDRVFEMLGEEVSELCAELVGTMRPLDNRFSAQVETSDDSNKHWFKVQIVEIADNHGYFCDLQTYHRWVRLKLRHATNEAQEDDEIVFSLHSLGRNFSGVLALAGYFASRELDADGRRGSGPLREIAERPLSFSYNEDLTKVRSRVVEWMDMALNVALEQFRREL
jgi:hypothetical protein